MRGLIHLRLKAGEAAGPPIALAITMQITRSRNDRTWRAGGLAGLSQPLKIVKTSRPSNPEGYRLNKKTPSHRCDGVLERLA